MKIVGNFATYSDICPTSFKRAFISDIRSVLEILPK